MAKKLWKFLDEGLVSRSGNCKWELNKWKKHKGELSLCNEGFHASGRIYDAMQYVTGPLLARVEVRGKHLSEKDKECWSEMRLVKVYEFTKRDYVAFAVYCAEQNLHNFESKHPNDDRVRKAIEAARACINNDTEENRSAAESARSAAESARSAAWSAAESARSAAWSAAESAAWSAESAAESAAWSAESAAESARSAAWSAAESARSARSAAWSAAESAEQDKFEKWLLNKIKSKS